MKLTEIKDQWTNMTDSPLEKESKGTYAGLRFTPESKEAVMHYLRQNNIPKPTDIDKLHVTLLYSRKHLSDYVPAGKLDTHHECHPAGFDVWKTKPPEGENQTEGWNALVMKFNAPSVVARHKELMAKHEATYDFPDYKPHITMSYNIGDMDHSALPPFTAPLHLNEEYDEELDLDWAANKGTKRGHRKQQVRDE